MTNVENNFIVYGGNTVFMIRGQVGSCPCYFPEGLWDPSERCSQLVNAIPISSQRNETQQKFKQQQKKKKVSNDIRIERLGI